MAGVTSPHPKQTLSPFLNFFSIFPFPMKGHTWSWIIWSQTYPDRFIKTQLWCFVFFVCFWPRYHSLPAWLLGKHGLIHHSFLTKMLPPLGPCRRECFLFWDVITFCSYFYHSIQFNHGAKCSDMHFRKTTLAVRGGKIVYWGKSREQPRSLLCVPGVRGSPLLFQTFQCYYHRFIFPDYS